MITSEFDTSTVRMPRRQASVSYPDQVHRLLAQLSRQTGLGQGEALYHILNAAWDPDRAPQLYGAVNALAGIPWTPRDLSKHKFSRGRALYWPEPDWGTLHTCEANGLRKGEVVESVVSAMHQFMSRKPVGMGWGLATHYSWLVRKAAREGQTELPTYSELRSRVFLDLRARQAPAPIQFRDPWTLQLAPKLG